MLLTPTSRTKRWGSRYGARGESTRQGQRCDGKSKQNHALLSGPTPSPSPPGGPAVLANPNPCSGCAPPCLCSQVGCGTCNSAGTHPPSTHRAGSGGLLPNPQRGRAELQVSFNPPTPAFSTTSQASRLRAPAVPCALGVWDQC